MGSVCWNPSALCVPERMPAAAWRWVVNSISGECVTAFESQLFFILVTEYEVKFLSKETSYKINNKKLK